MSAREQLPSNVQRSIPENCDVAQWQVSDENIKVFADLLDEFEVEVFRHPKQPTVLVIAHLVPGSKPKDIGDKRYTGTSIGLNPGDCVIVNHEDGALGVVRVPDEKRLN